MDLQRVCRHINPRTILDVGANIGGFYELARGFWPEAKFLLVEANPACEQHLLATGAEYKVALLADRVKEVDFYTQKVRPTCPGASMYRETTEFYNDDRAVVLKLFTTRLDDLCAGRSFDLLKIDVQGAELDVLRGGMATLAQAKAAILEVSHTQYNLGAPGQREIESFMSQQKFIPVAILGRIFHPLSGEHIQSDFLFLRIQ